MSDAPSAPAQGQPAALSVARALDEARALGLDRVDAHLLLSHHLGQTRAWLIAHDDAAVPAPAAEAFRADCRQRAGGVPVAYLLGEREFHGLRLRVTPDVLVPRPDTETLVDWAIELAGAAPDRPIELLDLGTGSGAIVLALAHARCGRMPAARCTATDLSPTALAVARDNALRLGLQVEFHQGAWWAAVPAGQRFDLVVSNPPYIREGDAHLPALRHEPAMALSSGADGLDALREIVAGAGLHLSPGGWLLLEHGWDQAAEVTGLLASAGFSDIQTRLDIECRPRCTGGRWPAA
jgi:release factor glutamine methyltransferase